MNRVYTQKQHKAINRREYPGTRQMCVRCNEPTERCEEDGIWDDRLDGWICPECDEVMIGVRESVQELELILEALADNTSDSNRRMAESGLSLIDSFKEEI